MRRSSARAAFRAAAYLALAALAAVSLMGARKTLRGVPVGQVVDVDTRTGAVEVDLGSRDGVLKGITFSVVDERGRQLALVTPAEIYDAMFWSAPLTPGEASKLRAGMEARWIFTPELTMMLAARKKHTPQAYREFAARYPDSVFLPQLVRAWPEDMLREVDPAYYRAWKIYTSRAFEDYIATKPAGGFAAAAAAELKDIKEYEAGQERARQEREKRAAEYQEEMKRQEEIRAKVLARQRQREMEEMHGKLVNNSSEPVRFVFDQPSMLPPTVVQPGSEFEVNHTEGTYTYKVFAVQAGPESGAEEGAPPPEPVAQGSVDIFFDFWEVAYP